MQFNFPCARRGMFLKYLHYLAHLTSEQNDIMKILFSNNLRSIKKHVFLQINDDLLSELQYHFLLLKTYQTKSK